MSSLPQESLTTSRTRCYTRLVMLATSFSCVGLCPFAEAQNRSAGVLEEVVVTSQRREEQLQDVPISISVLSGDELDKSSIVGITDAINRVPGVVASAGWMGGGTQIAVRGVGATGPLFNGSSPVAYYLDSVPFGLVKTAAAPDANAYDLRRVEVLRGPQGTLYGASAQNGVVRILTNDADLNSFEFKARTSLSSTEDGGENYRGDMAVNVPLVDGKLAARAVVGYDDSSGWIDKPGDEDANDAQVENYRLKINAQPTEQLSIGLSAWSSRSDLGAPPTSDDDRIAFGVSTPIATDYDAYGAKIGYEFSHVSLTSMTSYLDYSNEGSVDLTTVGVPGFVLFTDLASKVRAQEILLNSKLDGPWRWSAGLFYRDAEDRLFQDIPGLLAAPDNYTDESKSRALFGEVSRRFLGDKLEWTLGLRYYEEDVVNEGNFPGETERLHHVEDSFHATTPRAVLTWFPSDRLTVYASYSEGFRGGFPQNANIAQDPVASTFFTSVDPDKVYNYEIGAKGVSANNRLAFEMAVYFIDWQDVQQTLGVPINGICCYTAPINGDSASGVGVDFGVTARPRDELELGVNLSWNDLSFDNTIQADDVVLFTKGDRLNFSSEYTAQAFADYTFAIGSGGFKGTFSASAIYSSEQVNRLFAGLAPPIVSQGDELLVAHASFSLISPGRWRAMLFVDNATDEDGSYPAVDIGPDCFPRVRPRTVGLQLDYNF